MLGTKSSRTKKPKGPGTPLRWLSKRPKDKWFEGAQPLFEKPQEDKGGSIGVQKLQETKRVPINRKEFGGVVVGKEPKEKEVSQKLKRINPLVEFSIIAGNMYIAKIFIQLAIAFQGTEIYWILLGGAIGTISMVTMIVAAESYDLLRNTVKEIKEARAKRKK